MKNKLKVLLQNKIIIFCIPIILYIFIFLGEYVLDFIFGNRDGNIVSLSIFSRIKPFVKIFLFLYLLYNIFTILFKMTIGQFIFNLGFIVIVLYGIEFYLKSNDIFLKGPFDSGYYFSNISKYKNLICVPEKFRIKGATWGNPIVSNTLGFRDSEFHFLNPKIFIGSWF